MQGTTQGFINCVYVHDAHYGRDTTSKVLFLLFWIVQHVWLVFFPAVLAYAMMPKAFTRLDKAICGFCVLAMTMITVIPTVVFHKPLDAVFFYYAIGAHRLVHLLCGAAALCHDNEDKLST